MPQYRYFGEAAWHSMSGNALLALVNKNGSGKKFLIRSLRVHNMTSGSPGAAGSYAQVEFKTGPAGSGGNVVHCFRSDSTSLIQEPKVLRWSTFAGTQVFQRQHVRKQFNAAGNPLPQLWGSKSQLSRVFSRLKRQGAEPIVLRNGESFGLVTNGITASQLLRVSMRLTVEDIFDEIPYTFTVTSLVWAAADGQCLLEVRNDQVSNLIKVHTVEITEVGTFDSPYLQVVPMSVNPVALDDPTARLQLFKPDSAYPDLLTVVGLLLANAPVLPIGVPESYLAESSAGTPKGYNYLQTKDFIGPVYATMFPEATGAGLGVGADTNLVGLNPKRRNWVGFRDPIVVRPGETIGITSAAETAAGATNAVGTSGWSLLAFELVFDVVPETNPFLTLTGLQNGTEIRILSAGTETELAGVENVTGGSFSWGYEYNPGDQVDIVIHHTDYEYIRLTNVALAPLGLSIPINQRFDRNYSNP